MAQITFLGNPVKTIGELPRVGAQAPSFSLAGTDLSDCGPADFAGRTIVLNIFPSIDTSVCAASVRRFNKEAGRLVGTVVLAVSADLPFAHKRFCEVEGLKDVIPLSTFRSPEFGRDYGVTITSGPLKGLLCRAIIIIDKSGKIAYAIAVPEISHEPDYESALNFLSGLAG